MHLYVRLWFNKSIDPKKMENGWYVTQRQDIHKSACPTDIFLIGRIVSTSSNMKNYQPKLEIMHSNLFQRLSNEKKKN